MHSDFLLSVIIEVVWYYKLLLYLSSLESMALSMAHSQAVGQTGKKTQCSLTVPCQIFCLTVNSSAS